MCQDKGMQVLREAKREAGLESIATEIVLESAPRTLSQQFGDGGLVPRHRTLGRGETVAVP